MHLNIFLFGESEKGAFQSFIPIDSLARLSDVLGNPPPDSLGIPLAIQTVLMNNKVYYKRVEEEGFHFSEYHRGLDLIKMCKDPIDGLYMPGVSHKDLIEKACHICDEKRAILLVHHQDFYDFLTS
jgi:hypothetical protein